MVSWLSSSIYGTHRIHPMTLEGLNKVVASEMDQLVGSGRLNQQCWGGNRPAPF